MRTNIFAPLPQLVVWLDLKSECCGFESHEAYQYSVSFLCVAQSGRVLGLDPRGRGSNPAAQTMFCNVVMETVDIRGG